MEETVNATVHDPARFLAPMHEMHLRNASRGPMPRGNRLASQIDPDFRFAPAVFSLAGNIRARGDSSQHPVRNKSVDR
jgi:hypothetical protein